MAIYLGRVGRIFMRILVAFDILLAAFTFNRRSETISQWAARSRDDGKRWGCFMCGMLDWIVPGHCADSMLVRLPSVVTQAITQLDMLITAKIMIDDEVRQATATLVKLMADHNRGYGDTA